MANIFNWLLANFEEILATVLALLSLYFQTIQNKWLWPFGLISAAIFGHIFFNAGIYADMGLQLYFVGISIYGWFNWLKMEEENSSSAQIESLYNERLISFFLILATFGIFVLLSQLLIRFTNSTIPYLDAFTASLSITATWMLAKKYLENWLAWIIVDTVYVGVYFYKELYITIILYIVYTVFAIVGYFMWLNSYRKSKYNLNEIIP